MNRIRIFHRFLIAVAATISAATTLAGNTIGNNYTGMDMSADTVVPKALPALAYTEDKSESFPELVERVKQGDKQAYAALAECYRYGKGGAEKCMFNSILCYQLAGLKPDDIAEAAFNANPSDELGLLDHLMGIMDKQGIDSVETALKSIELPDYNWIDILKSIVRHTKSDNTKDYVLSLVNENSSGDEFLVAFASLRILTRLLSDLESTPKSMLMAKKVPFMYNLAGEKHWERYREDKSANKANLETSIMYFQKAYLSGFLTPQNAQRVLSFDARKDADVSKYFDTDDIQRLVRISGLEEDIDETDAVKMDMNPVEKIADSE